MTARRGWMNTAEVDPDEVAEHWQTHGYVILPGLIPAVELTAALGELDRVFPTAEGFHDQTDARRGRFIGDEFAGINRFPFPSVELSLLAVHDRLVGLAEHLLADTDLRLYSAQAWAKYTGACDYDQGLHRDYLNHTLVVPSNDLAYQQVEMFVFLVDVPEDLGPPHLVSQSYTRDLPPVPTFYPRQVGASDSRFVSCAPVPELYAAEVSGAGPAGTVIAFQPNTFHRGTGLTARRGARYSMHLNFRPAAVEWGLYQAWAEHSHEPDWYAFVARAGARRLALFGFPPPGHPYWTPATLAGVAARYPDLDLGPWEARQPPTANA